MAFKELPQKADFPAQEREVLEFWRESDAFKKMREIHRGGPHWSFVDGPITANNPMGVHHGWGRTYKDLYQRFHTMRGRELRYQNGFDCQGLWVEVNVERELGFSSKRDIEKYGLARFVSKCKERVLRQAAIQTRQSQRLGYWMDWNDPEMLERLADKLISDPQEMITVDGPDGPVTDTVEQIIGRLGMPDLGGSYFTFSNENNFMIWSFLKKCWEKGWVYRGVDVMPWCSRCATGISQHEIVTDGYMDLTHQAVTLRFPLLERENESLLVWTTTPWTLTSNVAAAVGPDLVYLKIQAGDEILYLSKGTAQAVLKGEYKVLEELSGKQMEGWRYRGPFDELEAAQKPGGFTHLSELTAGLKESAAAAHRVLLWDIVGESEGTGIVHIAPGCGAEDFVLGKENHLPLIAPLDDEGHFTEGFEWLSGKHVLDVPELIFEDLKKKALLYRVDKYTHRYPVCWRCRSELVFRLVDEWFISMGPLYDKPREELSAEEKAKSLRYQIMDVVDPIKWIPEFGHAREMDWLRNMHDWMISKKRYWGLALPIWQCDCGHFEVIGDERELEERAVSGWDKLAGHTPHRPYIDEVKIACSKCGAHMSRIPDVGNPWLDAGIVPFSTLRYRSDREYWESWYPAHWISECFPGQFRNWFYSLLAMATVMDGTPPFLTNFTYATLLAEDGRPMHKSWGNSIEFNEAADKIGVDVMRWLYCAHKPENDLLFGYTRGDEIRRRYLIPLWNVYSFFVTYANLDGWQPKTEGFDPNVPEGNTPKGVGLLDRWILARLNQVTARVGEQLERCDFLGATLAVEELLEDLTNWYIRRSRRRFWKSERDDDKHGAYATLYHVLVKLIKLLAPFTPFVTEQIYQNLVRTAQAGAHLSVHHCRWPEADLAAVDKTLLDQMQLARQVATLGLSARNEANLKVRQPLGRALVHSLSKTELTPEMIEIVLDELNVKSIEVVEHEGDLVEYKVLPDNKLLGARFGAKFPAVRKAISDADPKEIAARVRAGEKSSVELEGETIEFDPNELIISTVAATGLAVAFDRGVTVAIDTKITPELKSEGLAREVVRRIQSMRKDAGFRIEDRIRTFYQGSSELEQVLGEWSEYVRAETLSDDLVQGSAVEGAYQESHKLAGYEISLGVCLSVP
ncbi:MAG: isoleucine--tRNA ligase [Deltaproteobacteria bacterium]|nr:isoleucine--tRNA ligase [Deltaproteobacteria bacterium]